MLKNYFKISIRNLKKHKAYTFINVFGLAFGMACCIAIALFVQDELKYDRFYDDADRIYRVALDPSPSICGCNHPCRWPTWPWNAGWRTSPTGSTWVWACLP